MKHYLYILLFLLVGISTNAQNNMYSKVPAIDSTFESKLTGDFFIEGRQFIGEQYYNSDWVKGDILLTNGIVVHNKSLKYNGLYDQLIWLNTWNYNLIKIDKSYVKEFWYKNLNGTNAHFIRIKVRNPGNDTIQNVFVEVKTIGKLSLYVQHKISRQWPQYINDGKIWVKYDVLEPTPVYYIKLPSNKYLIMTKLKRRAFTRLFPDKKRVINKLIFHNHLNLRKESGLEKVIELMNQNEIH